MSYNGSGVFVINSTGEPAVANTLITAAIHNALTADLATGLSTAVTKDGQTTPTANIPLGGFKLTGVGAATARTDAASLASIQDGTGTYVATVGGTADAITLTASPAITAYVAGQTFRWIASGANTTAVTVAVSGLAAKAITKNGTTALVAGDIASGAMVQATYDGTRFILGVINTNTAVLPLAGGNLTGGINSARGNITQHATTMDFFATTSPDILDGTGSAVTITACVNAPQAGATRKFYPIVATVLTHGATFDIAGNGNLTAAAGDCWIIEAKTVSTYRVSAVKENGTAVVATDASLTTTDVTTNDASTAKHGFLKKLSNVSTEFMNGTGAWSAPATPGATLGTQQASTSGTAIDFTGIPAGTKEIKVMFAGVSTNGSSNYLIQIGDSGGIETNSYLSEAARESGAVANSTAGFIMSSSFGSSQTMGGVITLSLENSAAFTWCATGMMGTASGSVQYGAGSKSLSAELTQLRITMVNGTDAFNAGVINISYRS